MAHSKSGSILKIIKEPFGETTTVVHVITTNKKKKQISFTFSDRCDDIRIAGGGAGAKHACPRAS